MAIIDLLSEPVIPPWLLFAGMVLGVFIGYAQCLKDNPPCK